MKSWKRARKVRAKNAKENPSSESTATTMNTVRSSFFCRFASSPQSKDECLRYTGRPQNFEVVSLLTSLFFEKTYWGRMKIWRVS